MLTIEIINNLIGVSESFHAAYKLKEIMENQSERDYA